MSEIQVASRYAKSLIDLAIEQNALEPVKNDIEQFVQVCMENTQLQAVLKNPIISPSKKVSILEQLFTGKFSAVVLAFFKIVTTKGRSEILFATAKEFLNEYNTRKNIVKAYVVSAAPLSAENRQEVLEVVKNSTHGEVVLDEKVNAELIGGFILTVGDKQYDASIANKLNNLKKEFAKKVLAEVQ